MDFKDILEQWESTPEGKEAAGKSRFSRMIEEKEESLRSATNVRVKSGGYRTGKASLGTLKNRRAQSELDLHGVSGNEARQMVRQFLSESVSKRLEKVRIVHGRGLHSPKGQAVLRTVVEEELKTSPLVRAYGTPPPAEGGTGAVWVILQRGR